MPTDAVLQSGVADSTHRLGQSSRDHANDRLCVALSAIRMACLDGSAYLPVPCDSMSATQPLKTTLASAWHECVE